jgi:hypothetical protein
VRFLAAWCVLRGLVYEEKVSPDMLSAWESALSDLPAAVLHDALNATLRNAPGSQYWPAPGDVRREAGTVRQLAAERAWTEVQKRLDEWGFEGGACLPVFSMRPPAEGYRGRVREHNGGYLVHPEPMSAAAEYAVAHVGGWDRLRSLDSGAHDFVRRDFIAAHQRVVESGRYLTAAGADEALAELPADLVSRALKAI